MSLRHLSDKDLEEYQNRGLAGVSDEGLNQLLLPDNYGGGSTPSSATPGQAAWKAQHPVQSFISNVAQDELNNPGAVANVASKVMGLLHAPGDALYNAAEATPGLKGTADALMWPFEEAKKGYEALGQGADEAYKNNYQVLGDILNTASTVGGTLSPSGPTDMLLAKEADAFPEQKAAVGEAISSTASAAKDGIKDILTPKVGGLPAEIRPTMNVSSAENMQKQFKIKVPEYHGRLAQDELAANKRGLATTKDIAYAYRDKLLENNPDMDLYLPGDATNKVVGALIKKNNVLDTVLQESLIKKMIQATKPVDEGGVLGENAGVMDVANRVLQGGAGGSVEDWHDLEPGDTGFKTTEAVATRERLADIERDHTTYADAGAHKDTIGYQAGLLKNSLDQDIAKAADPKVAKAHAKALDRASEYYSTFGSGSIGDKFLNASPEKLHTIATRSLDNLDSLRTAGGKAAVDNIKKAAGFDIINKIADHNLDGSKVDSIFRRNRVLNKLFTEKEIQGFTDTADARVKAIATNKVSDEMAAKLAQGQGFAGVLKTIGGNVAEKFGLSGVAKEVANSNEVQNILKK